MTNDKYTLTYTYSDVQTCLTFNKSEKIIEKFEPKNIAGKIYLYLIVRHMFNEEFSPAKDTLSQTEKLEKYSGEVDWSYLKPHFKAGNLIYVDPSLDLKVAGLVFTKDDQVQVQKWLQCGDLVQPCELHAEHWEKEKTRFQAMIVRPFILAQPL